MSNTRPVRYQIIANGSYLGEWRIRKSANVHGLGKPTDAKLADHVAVFEASTREGGCNAHLGPITISNAEVVDTFENEILATYTR